MLRRYFALSIYDTYTGVYMKPETRHETKRTRNILVGAIALVIIAALITFTFIYLTNRNTQIQKEAASFAKLKEVSESYGKEVLKTASSDKSAYLQFCTYKSPTYKRGDITCSASFNVDYDVTNLDMAKELSSDIRERLDIKYADDIQQVDSKDKEVLYAESFTIADVPCSLEHRYNQKVTIGKSTPGTMAYVLSVSFECKSKVIEAQYPMLDEILEN